MARRTATITRRSCPRWPRYARRQRRCLWVHLAQRLRPTPARMRRGIDPRRAQVRVGEKPERLAQFRHADPPVQRRQHGVDRYPRPGEARCAAHDLWVGGIPRIRKRSSSVAQPGSPGRRRTGAINVCANAPRPSASPRACRRAWVCSRSIAPTSIARARWISVVT